MVDKRVQFKMTKDRTKYRDGLDRCGIYVNGRNYGSASVGADLQAVALAHYIKRKHKLDLRKLDASNISALVFYDPQTNTYNNRFKSGYKEMIDTEKGFDEVVEILRALGYDLVYEKQNLASTFYILKKL